MVGFSVYSQSYDMDYIKSMKSQGINQVFISLHIPEELEQSDNIRKLLGNLAGLEMHVIADISPVTLEVFSIEELKSYNIDTIRIDYGFTNQQIELLSKEFKLVLNGSTLTRADLEDLETRLDFTNLIVMHNFYPKEETGLSRSQFAVKNQMFKQFGLEVLAFIPGDGKLRGPRYQGLPTIEEHRYRVPIVNYLEIYQQVDHIYFADISVSDKTLADFKAINDGVIRIPIINDHLDSKFIDSQLKIRVDSNHLNLRVEDSRTSLKTVEPIAAVNQRARSKGSLTIDNQLSGRYNGELMIAKQDLCSKEYLNVVASIAPEYVDLIDYIEAGSTIMLVEV